MLVLSAWRLMASKSNNIKISVVSLSSARALNYQRKISNKNPSVKLEIHQHSGAEMLCYFAIDHI